MSANIAALLYLVAAVLFVLGIRGLASPETARNGNVLGMLGMAIAIAATLGLQADRMDMQAWAIVGAGIVLGGGIGAVLARTTAMTSMPQLVAMFNSFVGLAAIPIEAAALYAPEAFGITGVDGIKMTSLFEIGLAVIIGGVTFSGSIIAFAKLQGLMTSAPVVYKGQHWINLVLGLITIGLIGYLMMTENQMAFWAIVGIALLLGILIVIPIGGADMPVVISMLNSYSGLASVGVGFTLGNPGMIITGSLVGASGAILSYIMCKGMNRPFFSVILGGFGAEEGAAPVGQQGDRNVKQGAADDAAFIMKNAGSVIIVPGYGLAVAQAQHAVREMADLLEENGVTVKYAIHPVAGRMPGHMNVLLAEADVPYDQVFGLEDINTEFANTDVAFVIGANDVTNPAAKTEPSSPIYGMPVLDVENAKTVLFVKRSLASGYAGIENELFFRDNTMMLFADAKKMVEDIVKAL